MFSNKIQNTQEKEILGTVNSLCKDKEMWNFSISILTTIFVNCKSIFTYQCFWLIYYLCMIYKAIILCRYQCWFSVYKEQWSGSKDTPAKLNCTLFLLFKFYFHNIFAQIVQPLILIWKGTKEHTSKSSLLTSTHLSPHKTDISLIFTAIPFSSTRNPRDLSSTAQRI